MFGFGCRHTRSLISLSLAGEELSFEQADRLWRDLGRCPKCRRLYDRAVAFERYVRHEQQSVSEPLAGELQAFTWRVVDSATQQPKGAARGLSKTLLLRVSAVALVVMISLSMWWLFNSKPQDRFVARSGLQTMTLRLLCQTQDISGRDIFRSYSDNPTTEEVSVCPLPGSLLFAYTAKQPVHLYLFEDREEKKHMLWSSDDGARGQPLTAAQVPTMLDFFIAGDRQLPTTRRLVVVWCLQEPTRAELESYVESAAQGDPASEGPCATDVRLLRFGVSKELE